MSSRILTNQDLREICAPNFRIPIVYLVSDWVIIFASALAAKIVGGYFAYTMAVLIIAGRQHALFVLVHEGVHKHLARSKFWNDLIANWACAFPTFFDMHSYRKNHLKHHEHLNTAQDPDLARKNGRKEWVFPTTPKRIALYMPYFFLVWGPIEWGLAIVAISGVTRKSTYIEPFARGILLQKVVFYAVSALLVTKFHAWSDVGLYWIVPMFFAFPFLQRARSVAEHFGLSWKTELQSSRDVVAGPFERALIGPHHVGLHLSHHLYPAVPAYRLPRLHSALMKHPEFKSGAHLNQGYLLAGNKSVLSDILDSTLDNRADTKQAA